MSAREQFDDARLDRLQIRLRSLEYAINRVPFLDGVLVEDVSLTTSPAQVAHRLGRPARGCIVVAITPDAAVGFSATQPTDLTKFANIEASASSTADIWFW
jgi:hypothetical protein